MKEEQEYIFTFTLNQGLGYHPIMAGSAKEARTLMFSRYGPDWAFQYDAPNAREKAGVEKYNLHRR